ncbi:hypothetical protein [Thalassotalea montiporae]
MNLFEDCRKLLSYFDAGYLKAESVVSWADKQVLKYNGDLPDWLMDLSTYGPEKYKKINGLNYPESYKLSYIEIFDLEVEITDYKNSLELRNFIDKISMLAMGEDTNIEKVWVGYRIDDAESSDNPCDAFLIAKDAIIKFKPHCLNLSKLVG